MARNRFIPASFNRALCLSIVLLALLAISAICSVVSSRFLSMSFSVSSTSFLNLSCTCADFTPTFTPTFFPKNVTKKPRARSASSGSGSSASLQVSMTLIIPRSQESMRLPLKQTSAITGFRGFDECGFLRASNASSSDNLPSFQNVILWSYTRICVGASA